MKSCVTSSLALALAAAIAAPSALAMPADTTKTETYGQSGDWTLRRTIANGNEVVSCDTYLITDSERGLRYNYDKVTGSLGFSGHATAANDEPLDVKVSFAPSNYTETVRMTLEQDADGFGWRTYLALTDEPDSILDDVILNSRSVTFTYTVPGEGKQVETYDLKGYDKASLKTTECVNGPNDYASAEATPAAAAPAPAPKVIKGSCKLVVDGKTYLNMKKNCSIWMANDGTGGFWINTDRDTFLGDYFAEIVPAGDGTASGNWNAEKGATHAQSFLGEDFKLKKGGCWANKRATICAAR